MPELTLILSAGMVAFICLYMLFKISESSVKRREAGQDNPNKHYALQLILIGMAVMCVLLIGKASYDDRDYCSFNTVNATESGATTDFGYEYQCSTNTNSTSSEFYQLTAWFARVMGIYLLGYVLYEIGSMMYRWYKKKRFMN